MNLIRSKDTETTTSDRYSFTVKAMAPGKVILFGEHFVVYGFPSLIASIEKFFKVTIQVPNSSNSTIKIESNLGFTSVRQGSEIHIKPQSLGPIFGDVVSKLYKIVDYLTNSKVILGNYSLGKSSNNNDLIIKLESELPLGGGLGSSSAFCVALSTSLYYLGHAYLDKNTICIQSINAEKVINVDTSGADCNICSFGGLGTFDKVNGFKRISVNLDDFEFLVVDTGKAHDTYSIVERVSKFRKNNTNLFKDLCESYLQIYEKGITAIQKQNLQDLGYLLNQNHKLLSTLSISNPLIDKIIETCNYHGALGTKITGAGDGGCVLSLIDRKDKMSEKILLERLNELGLRYFFTRVDKLGLRLI
jgi:mevalonate kinase